MTRAVLFSMLSLALISAVASPSPLTTPAQVASLPPPPSVTPDDGEAACFQYECSLTLDFYLLRSECQEACGGGFCRAVRFC